MKRILLLIIMIAVAFASYAQRVPQTVNFSAVIRGADSVPLVNTPVNVRVSFLEGGQYGNVIYTAEHSVVTDANGFVAFQLNRGEHNVRSASFEEIPWANGNIWIQVEYRTDGDYVNLGTKEIASNYYAMVADKAERLSTINLYIDNARDGEVAIYNTTLGGFRPVALDDTYYTEIPTPTMSEVLRRNNSADDMRISGLANPVNSGDAATKSYVDSLVSVVDAAAEHLFDPPIIVAPEVRTLSYRNLTSNSVTLYGSVYYNGGEPAICGFVYGTDEHNMTDSVVADSDAGGYSCEVSGLQPLTKYYYKAFASNSVATTYERTFSFKTATEAGSCITGTFTDSRDGNVYATVTIGEQTWMAENLRYRGDLPLLTGSSRYVAYPNNDSTNVDIYGYLYSQQAALNWATMSSQIPSGVRGICPEGWHLPSEGEWWQLINMYDRTIASPQLAGSPELWTRSNQLYVQNVNFGASCFNAVPAGLYDGAGGYNNQFQAFGMAGYYWTSSGNEEYFWLKDVRIGYTLCGLSVDQHYASCYVESVRCVRDN